MAKKEKVKPDFRRNPDKIKVNDWVFSDGNVGFVQGVAMDTENMLRFFVLWNNEPPVVSVLAENLKKLNRPVEVGEINYTIDLDLLVLSPELQQRVKLDKSVIEEYTEAFRNHVKFPPVTIWYRTDVEYTGTPLLHPAYLIDGFHRAEAAKIAGITELPFIRKQGTFREALLYSTSINSTHGLRRSNADKRKAVMVLLNDEEWNGWSNREIASHCGVSKHLVNTLRNQEFKANGNQENNEGSLTGINSSSTSGKNKRKYRKGGIEYEMDITNLASSDSGEEENNDLLLPDSDNNQTNNDFPDSGNNQTNNDSPDSVLDDSGFFPEDNYPEDNHYYPEDVIKDLWDDDNEEDSVSKDSVSNNEDNLELQDNESDKPEITPPNPTSTKPSKRRKRQKEKSRLVNPLSVGDKVKVKDNHYFGGKEGEVTQIPNPHYVMLAFEDNQRYLVKLSDLNPPLKAIVYQPQKPQKKEIFIQEGCNYFAGSLGSNCKWYIEADEDEYKLFKEFQAQVGTPRTSSALVRAIAINKENNQIHTDDIVVNLSSKMNYLNSEQRLFLAKQLLESDPDIFTKVKVLEENSLE